jgi:hypothetical protein
MRTATVPWEILLDGTLKERASECMQAILEDLALVKGQSSGDASLAGGLAGQAILHGYLAQAGHGPEHADAAVRCLQEAVTAVSNKLIEASLYGGLTGVGWALSHLQKCWPGFDGEIDAAEIDEVLLRHLAQSSWRDNYDLVSGLVGFGVYALERLPRPAAVACLERVIDRLAETAERREDGVTWWTNPAWLPAEGQQKSPRGYYNLGLAHGVPGVIALLGLACAAGVASAKAGPLLHGPVEWLLARQGPRGFAAWVEPEVTRVVARFPDRATEDWSGPETAPQLEGISSWPARLAWCYGDPGVAVALLGAARNVAEPAWEREAIVIARRAARRPSEQAGVRDAGLCHGAAGLGHLFNRTFQATREPEFADAARFWFERTLTMRRPGEGIGGYQAWQLGGDGNPTWITDRGLLTGSTGIALALLAATTSVEPVWDRVLLTAIPPSGIRDQESGIRGQETGVGRRSA